MSLYSEDKLVEAPAMQMLSEMGWSVGNGHKGETFGLSGTFGRRSEKQLLLEGRVLAALRKHNPNLPDSVYALAFDTLQRADATKSLGDLNAEKYELLIHGISVDYKNANGEWVKNKRLQVFDFKNPENNDFLAIQQLWMKGKSGRMKRADVICFVNGVLLVFMELKGIGKTVSHAYYGNFQDYKDVIPQLFHHNGVVILSNGLESAVGTITSKLKFFHEWKRISEDEVGIVSLETVVRGICEPKRLMDIFEHFILFDRSNGEVVKLVARNHQYLGVNLAINRFQELDEDFKTGKITAAKRQQLGVFWHTQGSGKSYSMVFFAKKLSRITDKRYTFLIVTDRKELDKQIYGTFKGVGLSVDKTSRAESGENLKALLQTKKSFLFTLVHKFNFEDFESDRADIIVISDEAHRTQYGLLAKQMRQILKNAQYIGFTGTPLLKGDKVTADIFGEYVSTYDFQTSIDDGSTVPLFYENRGELLQLKNPKIDKKIKEKLSNLDLSPEEMEKVEAHFNKKYPVLTAKKRLKSIADDIIQHYATQQHKGKAMLVTLDKVAAVKMYNHLEKSRKKYLEIWQKEIESLKDEQEILSQKREILSQERDYKWLAEAEFAVVVSHEQNEISRFTDWGLDIEPHRAKMNDETRDLETDFKNEKHPFRFAIVCAMWLTGFDVPHLSTLYIDKPFSGHGLMQTITRANRIHTGKNNGLIIDYLDNYEAMLEALSDYARKKKKEETGGDGTGGGGGEQPPIIETLEKLKKQLKAAIEAVVTHLKTDYEFDLAVIYNEKIDLKRLAVIKKIVNLIQKNDNTIEAFGTLARVVFQKYTALAKGQVYDFKKEYDAIRKIYQHINATDVSNLVGIYKQVQDIVDKSVKKVALEKSSAYGAKVDLSTLDFDVIEAIFKESEIKNTLFQTLKKAVESELTKQLQKNPTRIDFYKKYQEIIAAYNNSKESVTINNAFVKIKNLINSLKAEVNRADVQDLTEEERAVFDILEQDKKLQPKEIKAVKKVAVDLLEKLRTNVLHIVKWSEKEQTKATAKREINDCLYATLPYPTYEDKDLEMKTNKVYEYVEEHFRNVG